MKRRSLETQVLRVPPQVHQELKRRCPPGVTLVKHTDDIIRCGLAMLELIEDDKRFVDLRCIVNYDIVEAFKRWMRRERQLTD